MLARNRLANVSFFVCSVGELVVLGILAGILQAIVIPDDTESNTRALSVVCAYSAGVWIVCAMPWFFWEQYRPGNKLPPRTSYLSVGYVQHPHPSIASEQLTSRFKQVYHAFKLCRRLKQTFIYLVRHQLLRLIALS